MDLSKEEERLVKKLIKARQSVERKEQYLATIQRSFMIAQREVKAVAFRLRKIRKQIVVERGSITYPDE